METKVTKPERLLPIKEVQARCGLARATIYVQMKDERFPKPIKIRLAGSHQAALRWRESDVQAWIAEQVEASPAVHAWAEENARGIA